MSSEIRKNISYKNVYAEPYLKSSIVCNAKRIKKNRNIRRGKESNSLWRNLSNSMVLQKTTIEVAFTKSDSVFSNRETLSSDRINACNNLCGNLRYSSHKQNKNTTREWFFPTDNWIKDIPLCKQSAAIFKENHSRNNSRDMSGTRLSAIENVLPAKSKNKYIVGLRFNCFDNLREVHRGSQSRIQSAKERSTFISPIALFRISQERVPAWDIKTRKCLHFNWLGEIFGRMFGEDTTLYLSHSGASGFGFLRPQIYRIFRRQMYWLRHCSQTYAANKKEDWRIKISSFPERLGNFNIPISAARLEETSQVYSYSQKVTEEIRRTAKFIYAQTIFLSGFRKQSSTEAGKCLAFLQREGKHRKTHQRVKRRLCFSKDSNKKFSGKSDVFPFTSLGVQHCELVQKSLFAEKISEINSANYPFRDTGVTCEAGKNRQSQFTKTAKGIYSGENSKWYYSEN